MSGDTAYRTIDQYREVLEELSLDIWQNPEGPFMEFCAAEKTASLLRQHGFQVELGVGGLKTAIRATWGVGQPLIGFLGEYDALLGLSQAQSTEQRAVAGQAYGHGCGHNLLNAAHVGAVLGLKAEMAQRKLSGTIVFYGCPGEELLTGKVFMAREGVFEGLDAALSFHPSGINAITVGNAAALNSVKFHFSGTTAHAGSDPYNGRSALDAVELTDIGANYLREHVTSDVRIHYVIVDGGAAPNIVPDKAGVWYYVRAAKRETVEEVYARLVKVAEGAAHMTETKLSIEFLGGCYQTLNNHVLAGIAHRAMQEIPQEAWSDEELAFAAALNAVTPQLREKNISLYGLPADAQLFSGVPPILSLDTAGSTDVGDVSFIAPTLNFYTACQNLGAPFHSWQTTACSGNGIGQKGMIYGAKIMAKSALELLEKPELLEAAQQEFREKTAGKPYQCPIPADISLPE